MRTWPSWTLVKVSVRLALILMTASLLLCTEVRSREEMRSVPLGLPIPFVMLDAERYAPSAYPRCVRFGNVHRDRMRLVPLAALADVLLLTLALLALAQVLGRGRASGRVKSDERR